jgi:hypothetical protein
LLNALGELNGAMMQIVVADEASGEADDDVGGWRGVLV